MVIRDPIHGDLSFTEAERRVMDTPQMQRLRGIRQTGTAFLVYPGCVHTRFEHALGTAATAKRIVASIRRSGWHISADQEAVVALAALVHDVSHLPFGHTFEDERRLFPRHDTAERLTAFLSQEALNHALEASGFRDELCDLLTNAAFDPPWMRQIVSSTVDADLLDYVRRDAYFAGLRHDYDDRIFSHFTVEAENLALDTRKLSTRTELLHLLRLRYFLTERVYTHHAKLISGAMIAKAVELCVEQGATETAFYELTDDSLLRRLSENEDRRIRSLADDVLRRTLLKRAYVLTEAEIGRGSRDELIATYHRSAGARSRTEREIADAAALEPHDVILYCPDISFIKEARVLVRTRQGLRRLNEPADSPPFDVKALEDQYERLWRFCVFAPEDHRDRVGDICAKVFGKRVARA